MRCSILACSAALLCALAASGATYVVRPDGTGDFPTIQAAINGVVDGDVIELTDGTFAGTGNRDIDFLGKAVIVRSQSGDPETCTILCGGFEGDPHRGFIFQCDEGPESVVDGVTVTRGWVDMRGGGVLCEESASPTISNCVFRENVAESGGGVSGGALGAITRCTFVDNEAVRGGGLARARAVILTNCEFLGNSATYGGGVYIRSNNSPTFDHCTFLGNTAWHSGGGVHCELHCDPLFSYCTIAENASDIGGGIDISIESSPAFRNCTLCGNTSIYTGVVTCGELCFPTMENCIISHSTAGAAVSCWDSQASLTCCDVYGNAGGDWVYCLEDQYGVNGNICEDPLFCGDANPDEPYTLRDDSPCAAEHNPDCGLIGAWGVGCGPTPVEPVSWGSIKAMFR